MAQIASLYYVFSLGIIGEWVNQGEAFLISDDEPAQFNEDSAALLNQKIDDHKQFFENYERTMEQVRFDLNNTEYATFTLQVAIKIFITNYVVQSTSSNQLLV